MWQFKIAYIGLAYVGRYLGLGLKNLQQNPILF
jgi:hypothetical protein